MGENSHLYFFRFFYVIIFENLNETSSKDFELKFFDENNWCVNISLVSIMKKVSIWKMVIPIAHTVFLFIYIWDYIYVCIFSRYLFTHKYLCMRWSNIGKRTCSKNNIIPMLQFLWEKLIQNHFSVFKEYEKICA